MLQSGALKLKKWILGGFIIAVALVLYNFDYNSSGNISFKNIRYVVINEKVHSFQSIDHFHEYIVNMKNSGFNTILFTVPWNAVEPSEGNFDFSGYRAKLDLIEDEGLDLLIVLDGSAIPNWYKNEHRDALATDFDSSPYEVVSFQKPEKIYQFYDEAAKWISANHDVLAIEPAFQKGLEVKYYQEFYKWQDYNDYSNQKFVNFLKNKYETIDALNEDWKTSFSKWEDVGLKRIDYNAEDQADKDKHYLVTQTFREQELISFTQGALNIVSKYNNTFLHFDEPYYTMKDAININAIEKLASKTDLVVIDLYANNRASSNHLTKYIEERISKPTLVEHRYAENPAAQFNLYDLLIPLFEPKNLAGVGLYDLVKNFSTQDWPMWEYSPFKFEDRSVAIYLSMEDSYLYHGSSKVTGMDDVKRIYHLLDRAGIKITFLDQERVLSRNLDKFDVIFSPYPDYADDEVARRLRESGKLVTINGISNM